MAFTYKISTQGPKKWVIVYENGGQIYSGEPSFSAENDVLIQEAILALTDSYPGIASMTQITTTEVSKSAATSTIKSLINSGTTFNTVQTSELINSRDKLKDKITTLQSSGLPPVSQVPKNIWDKAIKPNLLTQRQIAKKMLIMQGSSFDPPISEEDAQLCIYGKLFYKNGKLYDNDKLDPSCIAVPSDENYQAPIDENHPMWKKINQQTKDLEAGLIQLGIKLGEFTIAVPAAIVTISISLAALVSSVVILPWGSGIPTAMSAAQTMMSTIKNLQQKTAEVLPLLAIIDTIGLLLPKEAQSIIAQINIIFGIFVTILAALTIVVELLSKVTKSLSKSKKKMDSIGLTVKAKSEPAMIAKGKEVTLSVEASGGDYQFKYEWTDINGNIIPRNINDLEGDDDGIRIITPNIPYIINPFRPVTPSTTYTCKVTDGKGTTKTASVNVSRI